MACGTRLTNRFAGAFIFPTLDAFTRGAPDVFLQAFGDPHTNYTTDPAAFWAQDQWRPASGLTVVAGLRYEVQRLPAPFHSPTRNFAPRLGIAWQPHGRGGWVFRAGAGLFYDRYPLAFLNDAIQKDGIHGFEQYAAGADAVRVFALAAAARSPLPSMASRARFTGPTPASTPLQPTPANSPPASSGRSTPTPRSPSST